MAKSSLPAASIVLIGACVVGAWLGSSPRFGGPSRDPADFFRVSRSRPPQPGDHWGGCNDARAAGTAPIYRGEPGYRTDMDGDNDGIACEPRPDDLDENG